MSAATPHAEERQKRPNAGPTPDSATLIPETRGEASFRRALDAVEAAGELRYERTFVLRFALRSGTYRPAPRAVAEALLRGWPGAHRSEQVADS